MNGNCCPEPSKRLSGLKVSIRQTCESISKIVTRHQRKQTLQWAKNLKCNRAVECNSDRTQSRRWYTNLSHEEIGVGILLAVIALMLLVGLRFVRRYNQTFAYGNGGCVSTVFWTYNNCDIIT